MPISKTTLAPKSSAAASAGPTFRILLQNGAYLVTQSGDKLRTQ